MDYRYLIARRYLVSRKRFSLISIITSISVAGITLGTAMLIVVLSVMNGFFDLVRDLLVSFDPHVRIVSAESRGFQNPDSLEALVRDLPYISTVAPYVEGKAQFVFQEGTHPNKVVIVRGISSTNLDGGNPVTEHISLGSFNLERDGLPGMAIGEMLGSRFGIFPLEGADVPNRVQLRSAAAIEGSLTSFGMPRFPQFEVRGLFEIDPMYDESHVFIDVVEAQRLFKMSGRYSGIEIRLDDLSRAEETKNALQAKLDPKKFEVLTWYDLQKTLYDTMLLEKWGAFVILGLIVIVAAFNIIGSLTMVVIEKRRDLGILQAMGATRRNVRRIFWLEGLLIGGLGVFLGLILGLGLAWLQDTFELVPLFGAEAFIIRAYPVAIEAFDVLAVSVGGLVLCLLATLYPAYRASSIEPVRAIHWE